MAKIRIAVLFGGATKDNKISLVSAYSVLNGLSPEKYDITPIGITRAGRWLYYPGPYENLLDGTWDQDSDCCSAIISPDPLHAGIITIMADGSTAFKRVDAVFSALHGKYGEDGRVQGLMKLCGIPATDCSYDTAAVCMDKGLTHLILSNAGIDVPRYVLLERSDMNIIDEKIADLEKVLEYPVYVSAASCSSSIGANVAANAAELKAGAKIAFSHHHTVIVEEELSGRTIECAVFGNSYEAEVSALGELVKHPVENTGAAYVAEFSDSPELSRGQEFLIKTSAIKAYKLMSFKGCAKMSFRLSGDRIMLRRITPIPGFSRESALPLLMRKSGYSYSRALDKLVGLAIDMDI